VNAATSKAIVLVDDEKSYLDLMAELLSENVSAPVYAFPRAKAALEKLPQLDIGLIVTDYYMPQLSGLEFIAQARMLKPGVPFLIITGHGVHLTQPEFAHLPELKNVLHKPFGWRKLADEIVRHWPDANAPAIKADADLH
jgi:DNA-binding NtrC family response regulator